MAKWQRWMAAGLVAAVVVGAVGVTQANLGWRAWRYVDRQLELTERGKQEAFAVLWERGLAEYTEAVKESPVPFQRADYPSKAPLVKHKEQTLAAAKAELAGYGWVSHAYAIDLLMAVGGDGAWGVLKEGLGSGQYWSPPGIQEALHVLLSVDERKALAFSLPAPGDRTVFGTLPQDQLDVDLFEKWLLKRAGTGSLDLWALQDRQALWEAIWRVYPKLTRAEKTEVLSHAPNDAQHVPGGSLQAWLAREEDPAIRQRLMYRLQDYPALMASLERDGFFPEAPIHWPLEKELAERYPDSFFAKGIQAYEAVRGRSYFAIDRNGPDGGRWPWEYGNRWYDPDREIPGWLGYLETYRRHEGADDAAYRLGRCYEIKGEYDQALHWLLEATGLGDGEMAYHARGRMVWILDALLDGSTLRSLKVDPRLRPALDYSIAVRDLRAGRYGAAVGVLDRLLGQAGPTPLPNTWPTYAFDFWAGVQRQRDQAAKLQTLAQSAQPEDRYALAALIYHDELIFYNNLWANGRGSYLGFGGHVQQALEGDMEPAYERWMAESNNYAQAARLFQALSLSTTGKVAEKAAYSRAMALARVGDYAGAELLAQPAALTEETVRALQEFVARFPRADLTPEALLSLAFITGDRSYFDRILKEFPRSDAALTAKGPLESRGAKGFSSVPFRYLTLEEAPADVAQWARSLLGKPGSAEMSAGGDTYLFASRGEPGMTGVLRLSGTRTAGGITGTLEWVENPPGPGWILVRYKATSGPLYLR